MAMKRVNYYMKSEHREKLERLKKIMGLPISEIIRRAIDEFFDRHKSDKQKK